MTARAAPAAQSIPTGSFPSPRSWAERTRRRRARAARDAGSGWREDWGREGRGREGGGGGGGGESGGGAASGALALTGERNARVMSKPQRHGDLAVRAGLGREALMDHAFKSGLLHPLRHRVGRETEPAMGMFLAQEFEFMRREIDHQEPALGAQHAGRLADRPAAVVEEVENLVDNDDVEAIPR